MRDVSLNRVCGEQCICRHFRALNRLLHAGLALVAFFRTVERLRKRHNTNGWRLSPVPDFRSCELLYRADVYICSRELSRARGRARGELREKLDNQSMSICESEDILVVSFFGFSTLLLVLC